MPDHVRSLTSRSHSRRYRRRGFTLIELLFSMVIIGILTAVSYWRVSAEKQKATKAKLVEGLDHLMVTEESYFTVYDTYTNDLVAMNYETLNYISMTVYDVTLTGFHARAYEPQYGNACYIAYGSASIDPPMVTYNTPACRIE
ncbi:MAG: type II secretion system protein [Gemmatimonadaceae bacterium]